METRHPVEGFRAICNHCVVTAAWWGFTIADDRNRMDGLLRRGGRVGFYDGPAGGYADSPTEEAHDKLFNRIIGLYYERHLLHRLLPERHYTNYNLRSRRHDRTLLANTDRRLSASCSSLGFFSSGSTCAALNTIGKRFWSKDRFAMWPGQEQRRRPMLEGAQLAAYQVARTSARMSATLRTCLPSLQ